MNYFSWHTSKHDSPHIFIHIFQRKRERKEAETEVKTAVVWQRSRTCHHQRSQWQILHFSSSFIPVPSPLPSHCLLSKLSFCVCECMWLCGCVCVWETERESRRGVANFLCVRVLRRQGTEMTVCVSEREQNREMRVEGRLSYFRCAAGSCWG